VALLFLGRSWFLSTLVFYPVIGIAIHYLIKIIRRRNLSKQNLKNIKYWIITIVGFILIIDMSLRVFAEKYQSYSEKNYGLFYISPYTNGYDLLKNKLWNTNTGFEHCHKKNSNYIFQTKDFSYTHKYNELGIREKSELVELIKDKTTILTIGDSFTEGVGTHQDSTWQILLQKRLNDSSQNNYYVINAGISGHDPEMSIELYTQLDSILHPDNLMLSISENDMLDLINRRNCKKTNSYLIKKQPLGYYFYSWSYIFRAVSHVFYYYPEFFMNKDELNELEIEACTKIYNQILALQQKANDKNTNLYIITFPDFHACQNYDYQSNAYKDLINKLKNNEDIILIDILDFYQNNQNAFIIPITYLYWPIDGHMTPLGYRMWSEIVFTGLLENNFL